MKTLGTLCFILLSCGIILNPLSQKPSYAGKAKGTGSKSDTVVITLDGTKLDASGNQHILVGQKCTAKLDGVPADCTVIYEWSVDGNTIQTWNVAADLSTATATYGIGAASQTSPSWYWSDNPQVQTVFCKATITPPAGKGDPYTVNPRVDVNLDAPTFSNSEPVGVVQLNTYHFDQPNILFLGAGGGNSSAPILDQDNGITFQDWVLTPSFYGVGGTWYHIQLISVSRSETKVGSNTPIPALGNGVIGALDSVPTTYIYDQKFPADGTLGDPDNDNPGMGISDPYKEFNVNHESFQNYIMYTPPGANSIAVPLTYLTWSWNVDVKVPNTFTQSWEKWNNAPTEGTITPPSTIQRMTTYPTWSSRRNLAWSSQ